MSDAFILPPMDQTIAHLWMADRYHIPVAALLLYGLHILVLKWIMSKVDTVPRWLPTVKAVWDTLLSVASLLGAVMLVPLLVHETAEVGLFQEVCTSSAQRVNPVLYFFMWSKFFELVDTTFIILGKKNLIFLHWYHHMATLLYCWDAYVLQNTSGALFTGMNLCVHAVMYGYYAFTYFGRLPNALRAVITGLQLLQMIAGTAITIAHLQCSNTNGAQKTNSSWALAMYISYFALFSKLFFDSYVAKEKAGSGKKDVKSKGEKVF